MKIWTATAAAWLLMISIGHADSATDLRNAVAAETSAYWAKCAFWSTLLSLAISAAALYGLFRSLLQTKTAMADARELGQTQARAYVQAIDLKLSRDGNDVLVICKNSGETPSRNFYVGAEAVRLPIGTISQALERRRPIFAMKSWSALASQQEWSAKVTPTSGASAVQEFARGHYQFNEQLLVYGTIIYEDVFGQFFESTFAFFADNSTKNSFLQPNTSLSAYLPLSSKQVATRINSATPSPRAL